ncbi:hypothetical protein MYSTI_02387 [Myxococcus stipitatus DSM 14675]|uniref:Uncharacterized protein n=1 Tax=Myxococcus stipitatus (strain DSM 14675 / JCM 12634 / Mx s8) TaxID=1278073 RepID=L7U6E8_MYXSD|nr:hypothetical protein MYSTI_02387 [Myxococcus stipitatus DSM 14675]
MGRRRSRAPWARWHQQLRSAEDAGALDAALEAGVGSERRHARAEDALSSAMPPDMSRAIAPEIFDQVDALLLRREHIAVVFHLMQQTGYALGTSIEQVSLRSQELESLPPSPRQLGDGGRRLPMRGVTMRCGSQASSDEHLYEVACEIEQQAQERWGSLFHFPSLAENPDAPSLAGHLALPAGDGHGFVMVRALADRPARAPSPVRTAPRRRPAGAGNPGAMAVGSKTKAQQPCGCWGSGGAEGRAASTVALSTSSSGSPCTSPCSSPAASSTRR